jgi:hypothetical protein
MQRGTAFEYTCIHVSDALLRPEKFAAGFLLWMSRLVPPGDWLLPGTAPFVSFSAAPASLKADSFSAAQASHILCENMALHDIYMTNNVIASPRGREIGDNGWTVVVSQELNSLTSNYYEDAYHIRYAFVRARGHTILKVHDPPSSPPSPQELEVVGLREFLDITAPHVGEELIDQSLRQTRERIKALRVSHEPKSWPADVAPLEELSQEDAASALVEFLNDAKERNTP